jgi:hypothetical protein
MEAIEVVVNPLKQISEKEIEDTCYKYNLNLTMKDRLSSLEDNIHWHFKSRKRKGVLEITRLERSGEIIFSVHKNRNGGWESEIIKLIIADLIT